MGKFKNDRIKAINYGFEKTKNQLISWDLKFHELLLGKPEYDIIIDDKSIFLIKIGLQKYKFNFEYKKCLHIKIKIFRYTLMGLV